MVCVTNIILQLIFCDTIGWKKKKEFLLEFVFFTGMYSTLFITLFTRYLNFTMITFYIKIFQKRYVFSLELLDLSKEVAEEFLRYIYSDQVDNLDNFAPQLLSLAERFSLQGIVYYNIEEFILQKNLAFINKIIRKYLFRIKRTL